ncbi:Alpha/Beta hydrolase protein [Aspergillus ambiguus]|uniref:dienelactone hydrolase family protein n=1 Tax=Aspergillus ambiguus TaxID=176160 RepID=UPI003CCCE0C2
MSCPDCFSGHVHDGTPKGQVTQLHGLDVYVAEPSGGADAVRGIVIIIPDAFGWEFVNNRILADHYAEKSNYKVYLPEFMGGHAAPAWVVDTMRSLFKTDTLSAWLTKPYHIACAVSAFVPFLYYNRPSKSWPVVESFFAAVRQKEGAQLPIGAAGFCWGGKHTVFLAHGAEVDGKPLINAGFTGHPSMLEIPQDIEKIKIPVSFAMGEHDSAVKPPQVAQIKTILDGKDGLGELKVYYGVGHGFCVRADTKLLQVDRQATEAEDQALDWFNRQFAKTSF